MARHVVAPLAEVPPGSRKLVEAAGRPIVIFNVRGRLFAVSNRCPHAGGSLFHGKQVGLTVSDSPGSYSYSRQGEIIRCPWHSWEFDLATGKSWCDPATVRVKAYPVDVETGPCVADTVAEPIPEGPLKVETFDIAVERDYIIVTV
jgi:nitrite reductase/ring-hydroxylating ferredoxin subunit